MNVTIHNVKKTANGNVLVAFKSSTTSGEAIQKAVQGILKDKGEVTLRTPKVTVEARELDETATKKDVVEALRTVVKRTCELDTHVIGPSPRAR